MRLLTSAGAWRGAFVLLALGLCSWLAATAQAQSVVATITVGSGPARVAVNPTTNRIYVTNQFRNTVSVIDGASNAVIATIPVGNSPVGVDVNPTTNRIYVANFSLNGGISVIDGASNTVITTIPVAAGQPALVAVNPTTNRGYATLPNNDRVVVFDLVSNTVVGAPVPVGTFPTGIDVNLTTNRIFTANQVSNNVSVIDGTSNTVIATVPVRNGPIGAGANSIANRVYLTNFGDNSVSVIDGTSNTVVATVRVGMNPLGVQANMTSNRIYVANNGSNNVSILDGTSNTVAATVLVGASPQGVAANPVTARAYVANHAEDTVSVVQDVGAPTAPPTRTATATVTATPTLTPAPTPIVVPAVPPPPTSGQAGTPCTVAQNSTCGITGAASGSFTLNSPNRVTVTATGSPAAAPGSTPRLFIPTTGGVETFLCTPVGAVQPFATTCTATPVGTPLQGATVTVRFALIGGLATQDVTGIVNGPGSGLTVAQAIALVPPSGQPGQPCAIGVGQACPVAGVVNGNGAVTGSMRWALTVPVPAGVAAGVVPVAVLSTTQGLQGFPCAPIVAGAGTVACVGTTAGNALAGSTATVVLAPGVTAVGIVNGTIAAPLLPPPPIVLPPPPSPLIPAPPAPFAAAAQAPGVPVVPEAGTLPLLGGALFALGGVWLARGRRRNAG